MFNSYIEESTLCEERWREFEKILRTFLKLHLPFWRFGFVGLSEMVPMSREVTSIFLKESHLPRFEELSGTIASEEYQDFYAYTFLTVRFEHRKI